MARLGFKGPHTKESKDKISNKLKGIHPVGFRKKVCCPHCSKVFTSSNLTRHERICLKHKLYGSLFPNAKTLTQFRHALVCIRLKYGLEVEDYQDMYLRQDGKCRICQTRPISSKKLVVDHSHETGNVRALLCSQCNLMLGCCRDNPEILINGMRYLYLHEAA